MRVDWGVFKNNNKNFLKYTAYITFKDVEVYILEKHIDTDTLEEFMYDPITKKYKLVKFTEENQCVPNTPKTSMRKTWKSLVEQGWEDTDGEV